MGGGAPNGSSFPMGGEDAVPETEESSAANTFVTSTESYASKRRAQPFSSGDPFGLDLPSGSAVEPSSTVSSLSSSGPSSLGGDCVRAISNVSGTSKEVAELHSADGLESSNSSDLTNASSKTSSVLQDRETNSEIKGYPKKLSDERNQGPSVAIDKSAAYTKKSNLWYESEIEFMREKIRRYKPGDGLMDVGDAGRKGYDIPKMTTLLLVGPSGAGKSTLINNLARVLERRTAGFDRAQVYEQKGDGSLFIQEYVFFEGAKSFSVFDSRGFSAKSTEEDLLLVRNWMTDGICHGEPVCRPSDNQTTKEEFEGRGREQLAHMNAKRRVDFVIFVVNAAAVCEMRQSNDSTAIDNLVMLFKSPFLSFKDDRPAVVMTHGDELSSNDRVATRKYIGEIFGVSSLDQIFDVACLTGRSVNPCEDRADDLALLDMLDFAMQRADRNLAYKISVPSWLEKANVGIMRRWNELDQTAKSLVIGILVSWLFCLVLFLAAKGVGHHRRPWSREQYFVKNLLGKSHKKKFSFKHFRKH